MLDIEQYPLPKPEEMFATLAKGEKFSKINLTNAYLQLQLDEESRKLCTIKTHKGLFEFTRLPFGVTSAAAMFQRMMDTILQGIPQVCCYIDDILITGKDDGAHMKNLEEILKRLKHHTIRIRKDKSAFIKNSVHFLGHQISAKGVHPLSTKIEAIVKAPKPRDVTELLNRFWTCKITMPNSYQICQCTWHCYMYY